MMKPSVKKLFDLLTKPHSSVTELGAKSVARLLSGLLLASVTLGVLGLLLPWLLQMEVGEEFFVILLGFVGVTLVLYGFSRTRYYNWSRILIFMLLVILPLVSVYLRQDFSDLRIRAVLVWYFLAFVLAFALLSYFETIMLVVASSVLFLCLPLIFPQVTVRAAVATAGFLVTIGVLVLVTMAFVRKLEENRRAELLAANHSLEELQANLEHWVEVRTHDLFRLEEQYRALVENNPMGVIRFDKSLNCVYVNPAAAQSLGVQPSDLTGLSIQHVVGNLKQMLEIGEAFAMVLKHGIVMHMDVEIEDRIETWWLSPEFNRAEQVDSVLCISIDITESKRAQEALTASEARFRTMNDASPFGVFVDDQDGNCIYHNSMYLEITGLTDDDIRFRKWTEIIHPEDRQYTLEMREQALSRPPYRFEGVHRYLRSDASVIWVNSKIIPLQIGEKVAGNLGLIEDITERINQINARISSEEALRKRSEELELAVQELEGFSYTVSHDLRAPLRAIDGYSKLLEKEIADKLTPSGLHFIQTIRASARHMGNLIDDLLAFSRLGRLAINLAPVNMIDIVNSAIEQLQLDLTERHVEFIIAGLPACQGDTSLLQQVWVNLISNSIKFTRNSKPARIEIGYQYDNDVNQDVIYFIKDNGAGFDMSYIDKLFGVFQRLHRTDEFEGTGVGLAIVRRIIERHNGKIWADSSVGNGATFYFTIGTEGANSASD